ncbi:MAG: hypothetical protein U1E76_14315 [Planctomycetota bacterium]
MQPRAMSVLIWAPRVLAILYALFLALFALDVFGEGRAFWPTVLALSMHLIPTLVVLCSVALAWRWPALGAVLFPGLGVLYLRVFRGTWTTYAIMTAPLFLTGALFLISALKARRPPAPSA